MTPEERARLATGVSERYFKLIDAAIIAERVHDYDYAARLWARVRRLRNAFRRIMTRNLFACLKGTDL